MNTVLDNLRRQPWRLALIASWLLAAVGGAMHPDSDASDSMREELATMTSDAMWVPGHALVSLATILLALGLYGASRSDAWPGARRALRIGAIAVGVYVLETVMHLAAVVDKDALAQGDAAPIAFTHLAMAVVLYPVSGLTIVWVALTLARSWNGPLKLLAATGVIGGLFHAVSVPTVILFPDVEATPMFAAAGMLLALWSLSIGLIGLRRNPVGPPRISTHAGASAG
jgi:hypothetical protein